MARIKADFIGNAMTNDDWVALVNKAMFLHERLAGVWVTAAEPADQATVQARLERWCQLAAGGEWSRFARRLAWDGLDGEGARLLVADGRLADRAQLPEWAGLLAQVLQRAGPIKGRDDWVQPFVLAAQERLAHRAGGRLVWLSTLARQKLTDYLAQRLTLLTELAWAHIAQQSGMSRLLANLNPEPGQADQASLSLARLCLLYPVLSRQLATQVLQWIAEVNDFLARLERDWADLSRLTGQPSSLAVGVADLHPGLSDPHQGGRTVWQVTLQSGVSLAYKPKDLVMDQAWNGLLVWCNAQGLAPLLAPLWLLSRSGYGWMEWVDDAGDQAERVDSLRAGMVLGLLHLLHAADCHEENLRLRNGTPLLIDAEMLVYPQVKGHAADDPLDVLRTGLLPRWIAHQHGLTAFGGFNGYRLDHGEVVAGYRQLWRFLRERWSALNAPDGPLASFRRGRVRFGPRPTQAYDRLLTHLRHPAFLGNGIDFSIEADALARTYVGTGVRAAAQADFWPLLSAEHASIAQGDVPLLMAEVGQIDLCHAGHRVEDCLIWPPFSLPNAHALQAGLIRESLDRGPYLSGAPTSFLEAARMVGMILAQRAIRLDETDACTWLVVQHQPPSGLQQHAPVGEDLYAGRAGIALFLAGLGRLTGEAEWGRLALAGIRQSGPVGAALDRGGQIYALSQIAHLLGVPALLDSALGLSHASTDVADGGVLDGEAGMVLGLLALHRASGAGEQADVLAQARLWGERLLAQQNGPGRLGGFSHGAAGVAYALVCLYQASGDSRFLAGAKAAWDFQQSLFQDPPGNWQDLRGDVPVYLHNWCNGAAGIGLAGAGCVVALPHLQAVTEQAASLLIENRGGSFLETLCCGQAGQIDSLLEMGLINRRPEWVQAAIDQGQTLLAQAGARGSFRLYEGTSAGDLPAPLLNPTFFRGIAGIGYTLLRLAGAQGEVAMVLPSVMRSA